MALIVTAGLLAGPPAFSAQEVIWQARLEATLRARVEALTLRKIKTRGKLRMMRWEDVDAALAELQRTLNLKAVLAETVPGWAPDNSGPSFPLRDELDAVLSRVSVPYERLFRVDHESAYFPLTNNVLRLANDASLADLTVYDNTGFALGSYVSKYVFEKTGGLASGSGSYRLTYFQYRDNEGNIRPTGTINLLDAFSVKWSEIRTRPALLLTTEMAMR